MIAHPLWPRCLAAAAGIIGAACLATATAQENPPPVALESGIYYTVEKGDTLWDISERFFDSPAQWPDLWRTNERIDNPHWIYPGQQLRLYHQPDRRPAAPSADTPSGGPPEIPPAPAYFVYAAIDSIGFVREPAVSPSAELFACRGDKHLISKGDLVYVRPADGIDPPLTPGQPYFLYRTPPDPVIDPGDGRRLGIQHLITGIARVTQTGDGYALAQVLRSFRGIAVGDLLMPYVPRTPQIERIAGEAGIEGRIVCSEEHRKLIGDHFVAFVNRGAASGLRVGQWYSVFSHDAPPADDASVQMPPMDFGSLLVLHTEPHNATVLVTASTKPIDPGTRFRSPPETTVAARDR